MRTYQDLLRVGDDERKRKDFVRALIQEHKTSPDYKIAADAYEYYCHRNVTINNFQKLLYTVSGEAVPDNWSANFKMANNNFHKLIKQQVQHLLGNGISWNNNDTESKLGTDEKSIDRKAIEAAKAALWGKVSFGFYDNDHVEVFDYLHFAPLYDELDGSLKAGVRFWQIDNNKPLKGVLYEIDGFTKYVWGADDTVNDEPKRKYKRVIATTEADGDEIFNETNYPTFPIVPFWGNELHQSEIVGLREQIDCFDLIKSGYANTVDEASIVFWTISNAGGMDDVDLAKFVERLKTVHAATVDDDGAKAESHSQEIPYESREKLLDRLDADMYRDFQAFDIRRVAGGAITATEILAAYEDLNSKCDDFEYLVIDWLKGIMAVAGVDDSPTFTRSQVVNKEEMIGIVLQAAQYLSTEYVTRKVLDILGDGDQAEQIIKEMDAEQRDRFTEPIEE